jgi:hypothetical protein
MKTTIVLSLLAALAIAAPIEETIAAPELVERAIAEEAMMHMLEERAVSANCPSYSMS